MAKCPQCDAEVGVNALGCKACGASFEGDDAWLPVAESRGEAQILAERLEARARQARARPQERAASTSIGMKVFLGIILLLIALLCFVGKPPRDPQVAFWKTVAGVTCLILPFLFAIRIVYEMFITLLLAGLAGWSIYLGASQATHHDYLASGIGCLLFIGVMWGLQWLPDIPSEGFVGILLRVATAGVIAWTIGLIRSSAAAFVVVGLIFAYWAASKFWRDLTGRPLPITESVKRDLEELGPHQ
jgi:hypothetical protein